MQSDPFDIGNTVGTGIGILFSEDGHLDMEHLQKAFIDIRNLNRHSLSNGYLMRIVPMAIFVAFVRRFREEEEFRLEELIRSK